MRNLVRIALVIAVAVAAAGAVGQQKDAMKGMDMSAPASAGAQTVHVAKGVVKTVDAKTGIVTVAHGPVQTMNWPAMTMSFAVKDKVMLEKFAHGKQVEFEFAKEGKDFVVKSVK